MSQSQNLFNQGMLLHQSGKFEEAIRLYWQLLQSEAENAHLLFLLGTALFQSGRHEDGIAHMQRSIGIQPNPIAYNNLGSMFSSLKQFEKAKDSFLAAVKLAPDYAEGHCNLGAVFRELKDYSRSIECLEKALQLDPHNFQAWLNISNTFHDAGKHEQAVDCCNKAIQINPGIASGYFARATSLFSLKKYDAALESYETALRLNPNDPDLVYNKARTLAKQQKLTEALEWYGNAIALNPEHAEAYLNRSFILQDLKCFDKALLDQERALELRPDMKWLFGQHLRTKMQLSDWGGIDVLLKTTRHKIEESQLACPPFVLQGVLDEPKLQMKCAEIYARNEYPDAHTPCKATPPVAKKIKVAYFSSDFGNHPVAHLLSGLFEEHDRGKFEVIAFSLKNWGDSWQTRISNGGDLFIDASDSLEIDIANMSRSLGVDIAIDLNGYTKNAKPKIFAHRAAPIQASYIGFLGTMGAPYFDYLLADDILVPKHLQECYTEKIAYLPNYQCNNNKLVVSSRGMKRSDFGLPDSDFVYCSFNNNYKITPDVFEGWMRILIQVPKSILWIYADNQTAVENLKAEAKKRGVEVNRLIFADAMPLDQHLERLSLADLFLDTYPYNAGATASNVLRVGLPLISRSGGSFASRYGASLLNAVGLEELVVESAAEYESLAISLATDKQGMTALRERLAQNLPGCPLFDTTQFAKAIERLYQLMYDRSLKNLPPDHIMVGTT